MKANLYIILSTFCFLSSCDKSKSAWSIYSSTPAIIYSMTPEEEADFLMLCNEMENIPALPETLQPPWT